MDCGWDPGIRDRRWSRKAWDYDWILGWSRSYRDNLEKWLCKVFGQRNRDWAIPISVGIGISNMHQCEIRFLIGEFQVLEVLDGFKELVFDTTVDFKGGQFYEDLEAHVTLT
ncbi:unnamed protein product [Eruca vesicaria subsp. sativa]|uniref:Uncharacterized protein n=1 Tax=Eruca vesicaria subsp. sativa TaxID=29727 RepID=A0ABC8KVF5_ERUVS|nr:unnamed protein product [Eruca vesicaria subsp. sativa]